MFRYAKPHIYIMSPRYNRTRLVKQRVLIKRRPNITLAGGPTRPGTRFKVYITRNPR
jgi:hypothetical protein